MAQQRTPIEGPGIAGGSGGGPTVPVIFRGTFVSPVGALTVPAPIIYFTVQNDCTLNKVTLLTQGGPGSCVVDVGIGAYASFPTVASICAAAKPTIIAGIKDEDTTLTGWTVDLTAGQILAFTLDSVSTFTSVGIQLEAEPQ